MIKRLPSEIPKPCQAFISINKYHKPNLTFHYSMIV